jgi:hypothetical protein
MHFDRKGPKGAAVLTTQAGIRVRPPRMTQPPIQLQLTAIMARRFAWFSIVVAVAAFVVWGAALYDVLVNDWLRVAGAAFCAVGLSVTASMLARIAVRSIG